MPDFLDQLRCGLAACGLRRGGRMLVAVSGGADSVALLCGLIALRDDCGLTLTAAHLDHGLREASRDDALWVEQLCRTLDVPLRSERVDVAGSSGTGEGVEEAARRLRYEFLQRAAAETNSAHVALAHTADDQAETILHHILRGSGLAGLRGIPRVRALGPALHVVRPLLDTTRAEIEAWLAEIGQDYRHDATNADPAFTRNRLRHELLPRLREGFNPQVDSALRRLGRQAGELQEVVQALAGRLLDAAVLDCTSDACRLETAAFADQPRALVRECFVLLWTRQEWPRQRMRFADWDRLAGMVAGGGLRVEGVDDAIGADPSTLNPSPSTLHPSLSLPGRVRVERRRGLLVLRRLG